MASNVTIPVYNQQTDVPFGGGPRPLPEAIVKPVDAGTGLGQLGDNLMKIWQVQQKDRNDLQLATAQTDFQAKSTQIKMQAQQQPGALMGQYYQDESAKLVKQALEDPNNKPIQTELQIALQRMQTQGIDELQVAGMTAAAKDIEAGIAGHGAAASALGASQVQAVTNPDGTHSFNFPPDAMDAKQRQLDLINKIKVTQPIEYNAQMAAFEHKWTLDAGDAVARSRPELADEYIKQNSKLLSSDEANSIHVKATQAITDSMTRHNAQYDANRAALLAKFDQQAESGHVDMGELYRARQFLNITDGDYQHYAGMPFLGPSNPAVKAAYVEQFNKAGSPEELDAAFMGMQFDQSVGRDKPGLSTLYQQRKEFFNTSEGQEKAQNKAMIRKAFELNAIDAEVYNKVAPFNLTTLRQNANDYYDSGTYGVHDRAKMHQVALDAIKNNAVDYSLIRSKTGTAPSPIATPPGMTDAQLLAKFRHDHGGAK